MILKWLKKIFRLYDKSKSENPTTCKDNINPSCNGFKNDQSKKEDYELKIQEERVKLLLNKLKELIAHRNLYEAKNIFNEITHEIVRTKDSDIKKQYEDLKNSLSELEHNREQSMLRLLELSNKIMEFAERNRKEIEEDDENIEDERIIIEENKIQQNEDNIKAEQTEKEQLEALSTELKDNRYDFKKVLTDNNIQYLYHFTDRKNIPSIKQHGGLLSWYYCNQHNINIPNPGGGSLSRDLDVSRNLQDYVRLSFTTQHPMMFVALKDGRIDDPVILKIDPSVIFLKYTIFSNMNATIKRLTPNIGASLEDFKHIHFSSVKSRNHFDLIEEERPYFQAEVMVKTYVPKKYIINFDKF